MPRLVKDQRGSLGSLGTLIGLVLVAVLVASYLREQDAPRTKPASAPANAIARSRGVACQAQRAQLERDLVIWSNDHPDEQATIAALLSSGLRVPGCPEGGEYRVSGRQVLCSKH